MLLRKSLLLILMLSPMLSFANNTFESDNYVVHYNAFTADTLPPQMASAYGILRSKYKGVLNVSVQKKQALGKLPIAVKAKVVVTASNLAGQLKETDARKIIEDSAIYYISEFRVSNREQITFKLSIVPEGETTPLVITYKNQFYTN
jgi:hypothetical protein